MNAEIRLHEKLYTFNLSKPLDISLPLEASKNNPIAWYLNPPEITPVTLDNWTGSVAKGSSTNFNTIRFNPHAHGTHTECLGHITNDFYSINQSLKQFFFTAIVISVTPKKQNNDFVITLEQLKILNVNLDVEALVIRTLPNLNSKKNKNYSHTNPPYLDVKATQFLVQNGIKHLLIDLPSVDKEKDNGILASHKAFWNISDVTKVSKEARVNCTITEFIFVDDAILDGFYLLNLQIASFENDASPSKPILYKLEEKL
ncbi:MAG: kynurenine formamidase [Flavobacterium sp.]|jgi:kynurenine formamidase